VSRRAALIAGLALASCSGPGSEVATAKPDPTATASATERAAPEISSPASAALSAAPSTSTSAASSLLPKGPFSCGSLTCEVFETPGAAFAHVLEDKPLVLALGESHAQKGSEKVRSTTARFTDELLPMLDGKASSLVLELWIADGKCGKKTEREVQEKQKVVTEKQADENQNEFVKLGEKAKSLSIVPFVLRPTCDEYEKIKKAGDNAVLEMLSMITRNMKDKATTLFRETEKKQKGKMVVTYGGAMHNDRAPKSGREGWSFAADLDALSGGRYVELDLVVPEFIKDTESWRSLPWYASYDATTFKDATVLITMGPRSYALVFARSP